jgi:ethanolamine utilization protein EutQ
MMFGVMEMKAGSSFDWTLRYDEIDYIIDGTLDIIVDGRCNRAEKGDIIFIPKNNSITFSTPDSVRFMYVTYPANWADQ